MDGGFLTRTYVSMAVVGVLASFAAAMQWQDGAKFGSFVGGFLLAVVMLKLQQITVGGLLRPKEQLGGLDPKLGVLLLLPLKFVLVGAVLVGFQMVGVLKPIPMGVGFFVAQTVILARLAGWFLTRKK